MKWQNYIAEVKHTVASEVNILPAIASVAGLQNSSKKSAGTIS